MLSEFSSSVLVQAQQNSKPIEVQSQVWVWLTSPAVLHPRWIQAKYVV